MARRRGGPRVSRAERQRQATQAALALRVPHEADVAVVGGGASGLACAIAAEAGAETVVLERDLACGRTILATGNGRCNFSNAHLDASLYHNAAFVRAVCSTSWESDVLAFFGACGLAWEEEGEGRLYPLSRTAASVREVLLSRARRAGVTLAPGRSVTVVRGEGDALAVDYVDAAGVPATLRARSVVVACGHAAELVTSLGLATRPLTPVLCPLACADPALAALDGRRARATLTLTRGGAVKATSRGEVLFRPFGLSGICAFDLSRHAQAGDVVTLDLISSLTLDEARERATHTLAGVLDPQIAAVLLAECGSPEAALERAKAWALPVTGLAEVERAQVMRGGLVCEQFSPATLMARERPGLFACGEALDVDGPCGGYNLAWAWKSGMVAGEAAARHARRS